ncbi:HAD family hydrolase [Neisseria sp. Ec49-e6-T10]|uniref:HAD family hydrolase n=1 Tax=Neisseria sp. Ec49-e6-T10 TaxID=3140744 RepID=UPI003EBEA063
MNTKAVLFDLDGTLADTALDLGLALNNLLIKHGKPTFTMEKLRPLASHGSSAFVQLGFGFTPDDPRFTQTKLDYLAEYEHCFNQQTVLFDGVNELISALQEKGLIWGIITNKPKAFTDRLVQKLNFIIPPHVVVSGDTTSEAKPSIKPMLYACEQINVKPEQCIYVGDAQRDIVAGKNAGMKTVLANWGYIAENDAPHTWGADVQIDHPLALLSSCFE